MRVICVKWGNKYSGEWVHKLRGMVARHLPAAHEFVCMTDKPIDGARCVPCPEGLPGWWAKVGLFEPGRFPGLNLDFDLDVVIRDTIPAINYTPGKVTAPDDFSYSLLNPKQGIGPDMQRLLGGAGTINSSVMMWHGDDGRDVWDKFRPEKMQEVHGDQNWITQALWPDKLTLMNPGVVCSYKYHVMRGVKPAPVVVFHGDPKVTDLSKTDPLRIAWAA
jgi:hypothetical protein